MLLRDGFVQLPHSIARATTLPPAEKVTLIVLASVAGSMQGSTDDEGAGTSLVQPSMKRLTAWTGVGRTKQKAAIANLQKLNLIRLHERYDANGLQLAHRYVIRTSAIVKLIERERRLALEYARRGPEREVQAVDERQMSLEGEGSPDDPRGSRDGPLGSSNQQNEGAATRPHPSDDPLKNKDPLRDPDPDFRTDPDPDQPVDLSSSGGREAEGVVWRPPYVEAVQRALLEDIAGQISRANFDTWLEDVELYEDRPGHWSLWHRSEFGAEWLSKRLRPSLIRSLAAVLEEMNLPALIDLDIVSGSFDA